MEVRFADHSKFHRAAAGMVGASALLGLALSPVTGLAPVVGGLAGVALGATFAHGRPVWRLAPAMLAVGGILLFANHGLATSTLAPVLAVGSLVFGAGLAVGLRGVRGLLSLALGATVALLATWTALRFDHAHALHAWPTWLVSSLSATAMGIVGVLAMLPRHLAVTIDPVAAAVRRLPAGLPADVKDLCDRSVKIWTSTKHELRADEPGRGLVRDGVLKTLEVAVKTAKADGSGPRDADIQSRIADLDTRIAAATDAEAKAQYESARAALADQARYRESQKNSRERLVARMHNHVAAIEKFHLAATSLPSGKHDELCAEVATTGEAMAELELA